MPNVAHDTHQNAVCGGCGTPMVRVAVLRRDERYEDGSVDAAGCLHTSSKDMGDYRLDRSGMPVVRCIGCGDAIFYVSANS